MHRVRMSAFGCSLDPCAVVAHFQTDTRRISDKAQPEWKSSFFHLSVY